MRWFEAERRALPWRSGRRDPYRVWVSEVMLQQTTAEVVASSFPRFMARFPTLSDLARAPVEDVLQAWSGLGYYRRARSLHAAAREVMRNHEGRLPSDPTSLAALPGIGAYTSAAIAAMAFGRRTVAVDGNVARVLARFFFDEGDIARESVRRRLAQAFEERLPADAPSEVAEALIEVGALLCRPLAPRCESCPLACACEARRAGRQTAVPVKKPARPMTDVRSIRGVLVRGGRMLLIRRPEDAGLLPGFWELPGAWIRGTSPSEEVLGTVLSGLGLAEIHLQEICARARHAITHHRIASEAWRVRASGSPRRGEARFFTRAEMDRERLTTESRKLLSALART